MKKCNCKTPDLKTREHIFLKQKGGRKMCNAFQATCRKCGLFAGWFKHDPDR